MSVIVSSKSVPTSFLNYKRIINAVWRPCGGNLKLHGSIEGKTHPRSWRCERPRLCSDDPNAFKLWVIAWQEMTWSQGCGLLNLWSADGQPVPVKMSSSTNRVVISTLESLNFSCSKHSITFKKQTDNLKPDCKEVQRQTVATQLGPISWLFFFFFSTFFHFIIGHEISRFVCSCRSSWLPVSCFLSAGSTWAAGAGLPLTPRSTPSRRATATRWRCTR